MDWPSEQQRYIVMEYVDGLPIDDYCVARRLPIDDRIRLMLQVTPAVIYAHRYLVVHVDLKPANVLVTAEGQAKLLDFGIATIVRKGNAQQLKSADASEGYTPSFASPEQRAGRPVSVATDVYGLGVLALVLLSGVASVEASVLSSPDAGVQEAPSQTLKRLGREALGEIATARSTTPAALVNAIAGDLDAILLKALNADADHRYLTVEEMSDDLRQHLAGLRGQSLLIPNISRRILRLGTRGIT